MKVAIIGSNGFIGKHLAKALNKLPHIQLFLFGRTNKNLSGIDVSYKSINLFEPTSLKDVFTDFDLVYYLNSDSIPSTSWHNPYLEVEQNLLPFLNFMELAVKAKVKKVAFVSSAGTIYGTTAGKVKEESNKHPFSPYGIMKLNMENFLNYYKVKHNIEYDIYRVSNVFGEGQNTSKGLGIINTFIENILKNGTVNVFGDGNNTRNYIYVKDVAQLMLHSVEQLNDSQTFNISSNNTYSINELIEVMKKVIQEPFKVNYQTSRQSDNAFIDLDNSKISKLKPHFNFTDIENGIFKTYVFIKSQIEKK
jgi:UDP-glucose 4-epimerase